MITFKYQNKHVNKNQQGQDLVEFAILLPLLVLIAFGVLDLGRLFHAAITVTNAAREGVRYATFEPADISGIKSVSESEAADSGIIIPTDNVQVSCPEVVCDSGLPIRVTIQYDFQLILGFVFADPTIQFFRYAEMMVP